MNYKSHSNLTKVNILIRHTRATILNFVNIYWSNVNLKMGVPHYLPCTRLYLSFRNMLELCSVATYKYIPWRGSSRWLQLSPHRFDGQINWPERKSRDWPLARSQIRFCDQSFSTAIAPSDISIRETRGYSGHCYFWPADWRARFNTW